MPLIAVTGPVCAGKHTVADWLVQHHAFRRIILQKSPKRDASSSPTKRSPRTKEFSSIFSSVEDLIDYATRHWRENLVVTDISLKSEYDALSKRPFFLLVSVDAPLLTRWHRFRGRCVHLEEEVPTLEAFVEMSDSHFYGTESSSHTTSSAAGLSTLGDLGHAAVFLKSSLRIMNIQKTVTDFHKHLEELDVVNQDRIRPSWDAYFMQLASLASLRSNCMKRRVGCVLVRNKRVISTGYNGTPRGLTNCNEGGCSRCNSASAGGVGLGTCLCLHAEENALLESGRDRVGDEATLYCNTCPCLTCSVKIAQVGVKEVIYNQAYSMDDESAKILKQAGVVLRQFSPPYED
ncbi:Deoxycytidylate deaminase [Taphrina deformans PYCC 5710]|uniref:Deoxycytidylate deaminase n=1 Tax=Taphrina deformans (strain PYCC 5710 / ATCC 11124 / CBS 356.35 / IMI 108563 / JCM 9778 / NBRC 8474) TaxID=1097556 RepID=R4XB04_TAPDE|nr:Deoxycytidylate deaminase [Taphrina deformans PYCC 5710]|eukprot:CCG82754.1 Deoxycytidylate deaminase [Taphrina deformans PYCC 5710]